MKERLRERAAALGFDLCRVAPAAAFSEAGHYLSWLSHEMHGTMGYMAKNQESRLDIRQWHPAAKSVVMLATSYFKKVAAADPREQGRIASYALTHDYHKTIGKGLDALALWVRERGGEAKPFVDTSPILERLYARYAGLGWVGKNTMVIAPRMGSYFFLSGMSTDLELEADEPVPDHCGTCNKCIEACPTDAFPQPRVLDASRCIAYLTIEHRGPVPPALRGGTGAWLFGCDICQDVCPWNRFAKESPAQKVIEGLMPLEAAARLTEAEFKARMKPTPVSRAKWQGFVRNALLAMGNSRNPRFLDVLKDFENHADPVLAEQARWSIASLQAKGSSTISPLPEGERAG